MESDGPQVAPGAWEQIGSVTSRYISEPVSLRQVREYVAATGGDLGRWPTTASGEVATPPLFFHAACRPVVAEAELKPDGQYPFLGVSGVTGRTMAGGHRYEVVGAVYVGDVLSATEVLVGIDERQGRSGRLVFTTTETTYVNQRDVVVGRYRQTIVFR
jgi:hydroxyacyl-ACP dehydratase HTD2-like protein with hotdog domain